VQKAIDSFDSKDIRPIKLWSEDEARFGRMNNPKRCWTPKNIRPIVHLQRIREYIYVFSATSPWTGEVFSLIFPLCNTNAMQLFLQEFSEMYRDYRNIMVVDQAAWHVTKHLSVFDNIRFILLPPGSPELNPTEHLWEHIREKYFGNQIFGSIDEFENKMVEVLQMLHSEQKTLKNLVGFHWMTNLSNC
jgi:putative transposase